MNCLDFSEQLHEHLDRRGDSLPDDLQAHACACAACQRLLDEYVRLDGAVAQWNRQVPHAALADAVLASLPGAMTDFSTVRVGQPLRASAGWFVFAAAMALLLMTGIGWQISHQASHVQKERAQSANTIASRMSSTETAPRLDELLQDARDAYAVLASQAWQQAAATNLLLPPAGSTIPFPAPPSLDEWPDTFAQPLSPIGRELRDAVNSLWNQVFPNQESST